MTREDPAGPGDLGADDGDLPPGADGLPRGADGLPPAADDPAPAALTDAYRAAIGRLPAGVAVVTVRWRGTDHATTVSALTSVSLEPPMLLCCVHQDSRLRDALDDVGTWAVSVLAADQAPVAEWLAAPGRPAVGQLDRVPHLRAPLSGAAWVAGAAARFECRTAQVVPAGDHDVVIAEVLSAAEGPPGAGSLVHLRRRLRPLA